MMGEERDQKDDGDRNPDEPQHDRTHGDAPFLNKGLTGEGGFGSAAPQVGTAPDVRTDDIGTPRSR